MRISDWSSDVCSSDLTLGDCGAVLEQLRGRAQRQQRVVVAQQLGIDAVAAQQALGIGAELMHQRAVPPQATGPDHCRHVSKSRILVSPCQVRLAERPQTELAFWNRVAAKPARFRRSEGRRGGKGCVRSW